MRPLILSLLLLFYTLIPPNARAKPLQVSSLFFSTTDDKRTTDRMSSIFLKATNDRRRLCNLNDLKMGDASLNLAAKMQADNMKKYRFMQHHVPEDLQGVIKSSQHNLGERYELARATVPNPPSTHPITAENLSKKTIHAQVFQFPMDEIAQDAIEGFSNSLSHRNILLEPCFTHMGYYATTRHEECQDERGTVHSCTVIEQTATYGGMAKTDMIYVGDSIKCPTKTTCDTPSNYQPGQNQPVTAIDFEATVDQNTREILDEHVVPSENEDGGFVKWLADRLPVESQTADAVDQVAGAVNHGYGSRDHDGVEEFESEDENSNAYVESQPTVNSAALVTWPLHVTLAFGFVLC